MSRDAAREAWVDEARRADCWAMLNRFAPGHRVKASRNECVGPCPVCGGTDRFSVSRRKNLFHCRGSGRGGDAIALTEYLTGADFAGAVAAITGRPAPSGPQGTAPDEAALERRRAARAAEDAAREKESNDFRTREIRRAHDIWRDAGPLTGSVAEAYLRHRGLAALAGAKLRSRSRLAYWHHIDGTWRVIHEGPALVAAIVGADGRFQGCHCTWIDLGTRKGKAEVAHPETGELLPAKKVRGSAKGGHIALGGPEQAVALIVGEGIETVLAVWMALAAAGDPLAGALFWAAISLGNIGGRARAQVAHPTATLTDSRGRVRRRLVPGPEPDMDDRDCLMPPDTARDIVLLGDGDSDRFATECVLRRAAARWAAPGRRVRVAWAAPGQDFCDMLTEAA